jgi:RNA polymerase sigma factor (sigma-70 family)
MPVSPNHYADGPEALVVSLAAKGDHEAFAELVRRRQSWIRNLMRRCSNDPVLADDLAQQVFLQAWGKLRQLQDADKFGAWLKRLAINLWLQHQRKHDPLAHTESEDNIELAGSDKTSVAVDLDRALSTLAGEVRTCIVLSYHERLSHAEIAELTGIQLGTVKSHIRRGSERLRIILAAYGEST